MKAALAAGILLFIGLFALTMVPHSSTARQRAEQEEFTSEEIEQGLRLTSQRNLIFWSATFVTLGFYTWLVFSGRARKLTDWCERKTGGRWWLTLCIVALFCFVVERLLRFPLAVISLENLRAWGMTERSFFDWLVDYGKTVALTAGLGAVFILGLYLLMRRFPRWWWLMTAVIAGAIGVGFAYILPIWIEPLFNTFEPLENSRSQLAKRLKQLTERAGVPVQEVLVKDASRQSLFTNAYFTGFGDTRRIVLFDTLLQKHPDAEVESIVAHEIGHWQHRHIQQGLALAVVGGLLGFFLLARILRWAVQRPPFHLKHPADPAGWPLVLLLVLLSNWLILPIENTVSRHFERQADWTSLELDRRPNVYIAAQRRLSRENLANVAPNPWVVWLFYSHPSAVDRIEMARQWQRGGS